ncbi:MAG: DNA adenine methylase [Patescibacteria group bacterium]
MPIHKNYGEARPFLKWVGGKGQLLPELLKRVPESFGTYFEPFLGGGAVYFALKPKKAVLNDLNDHLITSFRVIKNDTSALIRRLKKIEKDFLEKDYDERKKMFLRLRDKFNIEKLDSLERSALMIFLNKTCFNGMYRENSKGGFNVPFGKYQNPKICDSENLENVSKILKGAKLIAKSFSAAVKDAKKGDFVYFDPPYLPISKTSSFTSYYEADFALQEQIELRDLFADLAKRGVYVMASNAHSSVIKDLYKDFKIYTVLAGRSINSKGDKRGKIKEYIITSF